MAFRCPGAEPAATVRLEGYRLAFRGNGGGVGGATIIPESGSHGGGVLWRISEQNEKALNRYEGWPYLYGKEPVSVTGQDGRTVEAMAYTMNPPYRNNPALPSRSYLEGILHGCAQNGIELSPVMEAVKETRKELQERYATPKRRHRPEKGPER